MKLSEISDLINEIEAKFPVDEWVVDSIHVWPWIRIKLSTDIIYLNNFAIINSNELKMNNIKKITFRELKDFSRYIYAYLKDYNKNGKMDYPVDVVLLSNGISYTKLSESWYEKGCDPFIDYLNQRNINTLLLSPLHAYYIPRYSLSNFIQPQITVAIVKALLKYYVGKNRSKTSNLPGYEECEYYLQSKNLNVSIPSLELIQKYVLQLKEISGFYKKILKRVKPKLTFIENYYWMVGFAFNLACRELDIPSMDIQHGAQGDLHRAYGRWHKVPKDGYELLPTYFWCWSDYEADAINRWSIDVTPSHRAIAGGNLFLELWVKGDKEFIKQYDIIVNQIKPFDSIVQILYTLNGFETKDELFKLINLINQTPSNYFWWLRCHPFRLDQKNKINELFASYDIKNVNIDAATELPLYAILRHMDIHITTYSSTVIEAEKFNVPSISINKYGTELYSELINLGWVLPAYTNNEIILAIETLLSKRESLKKGTRGKNSLTSNQALDEMLRILGK